MSCSWQASLADNPISSLLPPPQKFSLTAQGTWAVLMQGEEMGVGQASERAALYSVSLTFLSLIW